MSNITDIKLSILGSGKTTLCERLKGYVHSRFGDRKCFRFSCQEADLNTSGLFDAADIIMFTLNLQADPLTLVFEFRKLVRDADWDRRKSCRIVGVYNQDTMDPEAIRYLEKPKTLISMHTSMACSIVEPQSDDDIQELCSSIVDVQHPVGHSIQYRLHKGIKQIQSLALDTIALLFSLPVPHDINKPTPDSEDFPTIPDDNTAWEMAKTPEAIAFNDHLASFSTPGPLSSGVIAFKIAPTLIIKGLADFERFNNIFVRTHTNIPVPQPRYLHLQKSYIADLIPGTMLLECWDSLSRFYQFRIACTLRRYISQLRRVTSERPGSVEHGHVKGALFDPHSFNGPFRDAESFRNWITHITYIDCVERVERFRRENPDLPTPPVPPLPTSPPDSDWNKLVLTHCDLSLSNVILSNDGVLWIIDWTDMGFYPPWMESRGMKRYLGRAPDSWTRWFWFISGPSSDSDELWTHMSEDVTFTYSSNTGRPRDDYWPF